MASSLAPLLEIEETGTTVPIFVHGAATCTYQTRRLRRPGQMVEEGLELRQAAELKRLGHHSEKRFTDSVRHRVPPRSGLVQRPLWDVFPVKKCRWGWHTTPGPELAKLSPGVYHGGANESVRQRSVQAFRCSI